MIVVSDTSPLTNLAAIRRFGLLQVLFGKVRIPAGVWDELNEGEARWPGAQETADAPWISRAVPANQPLVMALRRHLDRGEAESIALALEQDASLILLDEKDGRHAAQQLGLRVMGTVGVLVMAKQKGLVEALRTEMDALRERAGFYIGDDLYRKVIELAGEAP